MSGSGSEKGWASREIAGAEEAMAAEGESNDSADESFRHAEPEPFNQLPTIVNIPLSGRDLDSENGEEYLGSSRFEEGQGSGANNAAEGPPFRSNREDRQARRTHNSALDEFQAATSLEGDHRPTWSGRQFSMQGSLFSRIPVFHDFPRLAREDEVLLQPDGHRRHPPVSIDLNEPAPAADGDPSDDDDFAMDVDTEESQRLFLERYDCGAPRVPVNAGYFHEIITRAQTTAALSSITGTREMNAPHVSDEGSEIKSSDSDFERGLPEFLRPGESLGVGEHEVERVPQSRWALRSMLRSSENHHKRPKFHQAMPMRNCPASSSKGPSSSSSEPGVPSRLDRVHRPPLPTPSAARDKAKMEADDTGRDGGGDGKPASINTRKEDGMAYMDLTDDLIHKVFSFLDDTTLCHAAMVCKQWRVASAHEDFWKTLNFEGRGVTHEQVGLLCVRYPKATTLNLKGAPCVDEVLVREAMKSLRNLQVLILNCGILSDGFFYALAVECSSLQQLNISDALLGSTGAQEIELRHESLRRLQIYKCRVLRIAIRCPQLDVLSLKRTSTASAMLQCPRLTALDVASCHKLSDAGVRAAATACPLLASLDMSRCGYVSDETLREISMHCTNLRTLDASYCPNISLEGVRMPMLVELNLQGCEGIISASMTALSTCSMLEDLALDFCCLLTAINLDLPRLRQISLTNNRTKFVELTLRCPSLTKLSLGNCPLLSRVDIASSSLQSLALKAQSGLSSMALHCSRLREVDLSECENLTDAVCDVFSDSGGCPSLRSLILDSCEGLTRVKLASSALQNLSLVGCRNIVALDLACPVLQQLQLDGCDHLTEASFAPVGLMSLNLGICPHLVKLRVEAMRMTSLDLRGCGVLHQAVFRCPSLLSLDASYCSQLGDDCLDETTSSCPAIQSLVLASCPSVGPVGLLALKRLKDLTTLDLSYTFLTDLSPIFESCPGLKVLRLSACKYLGETALDALHGGKVLPELRELDLSYGSLGHSAIEAVMALCPHLSHVSLNGCFHVSDLLWTRLSAPPVGERASLDVTSIQDNRMEEATSFSQIGGAKCGYGNEVLDVDFCRDTLSSQEDTCEGHTVNVHERESGAVSTLRDVPVDDPVSARLQSESNAGIVTQKLDNCGIRADNALEPIRALQSLSCVGCPNLVKVVIPRSAACRHLSSLNLSLSTNIQEVHLSCANLVSLNLSNCTGLVSLKLDCPRLISLFLQACGTEANMLESALKGCDLLETLDVRNCPKVAPAELTHMRTICPGLKRLYSTMST